MKYALRKKLAWLGAAPVVAAAWMNVAFAQSTGGGTPITLPDPLGGQTFEGLVGNIAKFIFWDIAVPLSVIMILVGAFQLMTSAGDPEKTSKGRKTIIYSAVGLAIAIIASGIVTLIQSLLGSH